MTELIRAPCSIANVFYDPGREKEPVVTKDKGTTQGSVLTGRTDVVQRLYDHHIFPETRSLYM